MSVLLLLNIGNSDLLADGKRPGAARTDGEALWETYDEHYFELPIIEPCLRALLVQHARIDKVLVFYTDQQATPQTTAPDRYGVSLRDKDTIWFALIISQYLRAKYAQEIGDYMDMRVQSPTSPSINPSLHDETFEAYGWMLSRQYDPNVSSCYVLMAGGIPACNAALQLQAISCYGERCRMIYQPEGGEPYELRAGEQVMATFRRATAIDALQRQDFATALTHIQSIASPALVRLIRYAHYRESFDFGRAQACLIDGIGLATGEMRVFLNSLRHELDDVLAHANIGALLRELLANAMITYRNGRYADFLGRVFRFQEAALRYVVEAKLHLPTDMSSAKAATNGPAFAQGIAGNAELRTFMDARRVAGQPLAYDRPTVPVLGALLDFLIGGGRSPAGQPYLSSAEQGRYREVKRRLDALNTLAQLRNQSVVAHGFAGVSAEALAEVHKGDPLEDLRTVTRLLDLQTEALPFDRIANFAVEQLRRGDSR